LRFAAQPASAFVTRVWRHNPPMRALRIELCLGRGSITAMRCSSLALSHREIGRTTYGTEDRKREEHPDHAYLHG
jgi:hypothetical protein